MKDLIIIGVDCLISGVRLTNLPPDEFGEDRVHVTLVEALVKGGAAHALDTMCRNADELGITLSLNACALTSTLYHTPWPMKNLISWYSARGFEEKYSINPTFSFMGHLMVRRPRTLPVIKPMLAASSRL